MTLKVYAGPEVSQAEFRTICSDAARAGREAESDKIEAAFEKKLAAVQDKLAREERELDQDESEHSQRKMEEMGSAAETLIGLFGRRKSSRRISSSLSKRRMTEQARADVKESQEAIADLKKQIAAIEQEKTQALEEVNDRWGEIANQADEIELAKRHQRAQDIAGRPDHARFIARRGKPAQPLIGRHRLHAGPRTKRIIGAPPVGGSCWGFAAGL